jgi:hypothetical protein
MMILLAASLGALVGLGLGALGGGGSVLTVPVLVYALGQSVPVATTGSLIVVGGTALGGALTHARARTVRWDIAAVLVATGVVAGIAGTALNRRLDPNVLLVCFAAVMLAGAVAMLLASRPRRAVPRAQVGFVRVGVAGAAVGFLTGLLGVGGGFVIVPALVVGLGLLMPTAVGTSLVVIAANCAAALIDRGIPPGLDRAVLVPFGAAALVLSVVGAVLARRVSSATLTRAFAGLLVAAAAYVGLRSGAVLA